MGHGDFRERDRPTLVVSALGGIRMVGVSIHDKHTLALAADGSVYAFGEDPGVGVSRVGEGEAAGEATCSPRKIADLVCMVPRRP
jgi:alpha-tubulin suppressor-like RCC1 family protein